MKRILSAGKTKALMLVLALCLMIAGMLGLASNGRVPRSADAASNGTVTTQQVTFENQGSAVNVFTFGETNLLGDWTPGVSHTTTDAAGKKTAKSTTTQISMEFYDEPTFQGSTRSLQWDFYRNEPKANIWGPYKFYATVQTVWFNGSTYMPYFLKTTGSSTIQAGMVKLSSSGAATVNASQMGIVSGNSLVNANVYLPYGNCIQIVNGKACFQYGGTTYYLTQNGATTNANSKDIISQTTPIPSQIESQVTQWANQNYSANGTYNGTSDGCPVSSNSYWTVVPIGDGNNAGSHTALVTPNSGYTWSNGSTDPKIITWTLGKAAQPATAISGGDGAAYGQDVTLSVANAQGTITWSAEGDATIDEKTGVLTPTGVGTVKVTATIAESANYLGATVTKDIEIKKGSQSELTIGGVTGDTIPYGETPKLAVEGAQGTITWSAEGNASIDGATGVLTPTGAGSVTVKAHIAGTDLYEEADLQKTYTIEPGSIAVEPLEESYSYSALGGGQTIELTQRGTDSNLFPTTGWEVRSDDDSIIGVSVSGTTITLTPTGKIGTATVTVSHPAEGLYAAYEETFTVVTEAKDCFYLVGSDGKTAYPTLEAAYEAVEAGGTVYVAGHATAGETLTVGKNFTLAGEGAESVLSRGADAGTVFAVKGARLTLRDVTLDGAAESAASGSFITLEEGASLLAEGGATLQNCKAENGGAVHAGSGTSVTVRAGATFSGNEAQNGGAIYAEGATVTVEGGTFTENRALANGGAVYLKGGSLAAGTEAGAAFHANRAAVNGGAVCLEGAEAALGANASVYNNAAKVGDGVYLGTDGAGSTDSTLQLSAEARAEDGIGIAGTGSVAIEGALSHRVTVDFADPAAQIENKTHSYVTSDVNSGDTLKEYLRVKNAGYTFNPAEEGNALALIKSSDVLFAIKRDGTWESTTYNDLQAAIEAAGTGEVTIGVVENGTNGGVAELLRGATVPSGMNLTLTSVKRTVSGAEGTDVAYTEEGTNTLKRDSSYTGAMITVAEGGSLTLENVILDGGAVWEGGTISLQDDNGKAGSVKTNNKGVTAHAPVVVNQGTLTMNGGATIQNNDNNYAAPGEGFGSQNYGGGVRNEGKGNFTMSGGTVTGCYAREGGAILNINKPESDGYEAPAEGVGPQVTIKGGAITGNASQMKGAAVQTIYGEAKTSIEGGTFSDNFSLHDLGVLSVEEGASLTVSDGGIFAADGNANAIYLYNRYSEADYAAAQADAKPYIEGNHAGRLSITGDPSITGKVYLDDPCDVYGHDVHYEAFVDVTGLTGSVTLAFSKDRPAGALAGVTDSSFPETVGGLFADEAKGLSSRFAVEYTATIGGQAYTMKGIGSYDIGYEQTEPNELSFRGTVDGNVTSIVVTVDGEAHTFTKSDATIDGNGSFSFTAEVSSATPAVSIQVKYGESGESYNMEGASVNAVLLADDMLTAPTGTEYYSTDGEWKPLPEGEHLLPNDIALEDGNAAFRYADCTEAQVHLGVRAAAAEAPDAVLNDIGGTSEEQTLTFTVTGDREYEYNLLDEDGAVVGEWKSVSDGKVVFEGLPKGKKYTLAVRVPAQKEDGVLAGAYTAAAEAFSLSEEDFSRKQTFESQYEGIRERLYTDPAPASPASVKEHEDVLEAYRALSDGVKNLPAIAEKSAALSASYDRAQAEKWKADYAEVLEAAASGAELTPALKGAAKDAVKAYGALGAGAKALVEEAYESLLPAYLESVKEDLALLGGEAPSEAVEDIIETYTGRIVLPDEGANATGFAEADELYLRAKAEVALQRAYEDALGGYGGAMTAEGKAELMQALSAAKEAVSAAVGGEGLGDALDGIVAGAEFDLLAAKDAAKENYRRAHEEILGAAADEGDEVFGAIEEQTDTEGVNEALKAGVSALLDAAQKGAAKFGSVQELFTAAKDAVGTGAEPMVPGGLLDFAGLPALGEVAFGGTMSGTGTLFEAVEARMRAARDEGVSKLSEKYESLRDKAKTEAEEQELLDIVDHGVGEIEKSDDETSRDEAVKRATDALEIAVSLFEAQRGNAERAAADGLTEEEIASLNETMREKFRETLTGEGTNEEKEAALRSALEEAYAEAVRKHFFANFAAAEKPFGSVTDADLEGLDAAKGAYDALSPEGKAAIDAAAKEEGYSSFAGEIADRTAKAQFEGKKKEAAAQAEALAKECDGEEVKSALEKAKEKIGGVTYEACKDDSLREAHIEAALEALADAGADAQGDVKHAQAVQRAVNTLTEEANDLAASGNYNEAQQAQLGALAAQYAQQANEVPKDGRGGKTAEELLSEVLGAARDAYETVPVVAVTAGDIRADKSASKEGGTGDYPECADEIWGIVTNDESMPGGIRLVIEKADSESERAIEAAAKSGNLKAADGASFTPEEMKALVSGKRAVSELDIYLLKNNARFDAFEGKYVVKILLPAALREGAETLQVVYVGDDGTVEVYETTVEDGKYLVFTTTHFSDFVILGEKEESDWWWWIIILLSVILAALIVANIVVAVKRSHEEDDETPEADGKGKEAEDAPSDGTMEGKR